MLVIVFLGRLGAYENLDTILRSGNGIALVVVGTIVGGVIAFLLFALTVVSLPMLVDRDIDYVTAMVTSLKAVTRNLQPMLHWAWIVGGALFVAMLPFFLGLDRGAAGPRPRDLAPLSQGDRPGLNDRAPPRRGGAPDGRPPDADGRLFGGGHRRSGATRGPACSLFLAERVVLALDRALEVGAALDRDRLVDDVALAAGRSSTGGP